jgi:FtsH-binding integral membrane protein
MFGVTSVFGYVTKMDLTKVGGFLFMGLIGIIIASVVNMFVASRSLDWLISYIGVFIFVGLAAYDTQKIKHMSMNVDSASEEGSKASIMGALALYLDFINLFLLLLRIMGRRK